MAARSLSAATDALSLFAMLTKVAQEARRHGWEVNISIEAGEAADTLNLSAVRPAPHLDEAP